MNNKDLMRSYKQYKKHLKIGHLKLSFSKKFFLGVIFFILIPLVIVNIFFKIKYNKILYIFSFENNKEPMISIISELTKINDTKIILDPKGIYILPRILLIDFFTLLISKPLWTLSNLDFFGALSLKISKYYGYKKKYNISKLLLFQEYSFYSSYLTYIFESENGKLYNMMHGIPGPESSFFRFSKCFVWGDYFKSYYISKQAESKQFIITGSIFHQLLSSHKRIGIEVIDYDILYALQGDSYGNKNYTQYTLTILERLSNKNNLKIAVKPHPIYHTNIEIPKSFDILTLTLEESLLKSKLILSHYSTIFLDAKVLNRKVLAFLDKEQEELVRYLDKEEICFYKNDLYIHLEKILRKKIFDNSLDDIINLNSDILKVVEDEIH